MKGFLTFLTVVIVLAIARAVLVALLVALVIMLLFSFVTRPRETLVFMGTLTLFGLASAQPIASIIALGIVALAVVVAGACQRSRLKPSPLGRPTRRVSNLKRLDRETLG